MESRRDGASVGEHGLVSILFVGLSLGLLTLGAAAAPAVSDIALADADPTNAGRVDFTVRFDESVTGVDTTDFIVDASGIAGALIDTVSGGGDTWFVSVGTGTGDGTLSIDLVDDDSIENGSGSKLGGTGAGNGDFIAGAAYTVDKTPPLIPNGLDPADGAYVDTRSPTLSWAPSTDSGGSGLRTTNAYRYCVNGPDSKTGYSNDEDYNPTFSSDGAYTWRLYARDNAGNSSDYTDWHTFIVDTDPPEATSFERRTPATSPTNADRLVFRVTFDEDVLNVSVGDFTVSSTSTATVTDAGQVSPSVYEVTVSGGDLAEFDGTVGLDLAGGQDVADLAGNALLSGKPPTDETYAVDNDPPGVTSVAGNLGVLADADAGNQMFTLAIGFDEAMDTGAAPAVAFPAVGEDPSSTIAFDPASGWTSDTTYVARYDVVDANERIEDIDVQVTGARDTAGNMQTKHEEADMFSIDTANPAITWIIDLPDMAQSMDFDCSVEFPVEILVEDNGCIDTSGVVLTLTDAGDVTVADTLTKAQEGASAVRITGHVTLSALVDGEATVGLDVTSTDCYGNLDTSSDSVAVFDDTLPTLSGFTVTAADGLVGADCEEVVGFSFSAHDNCSVDLDDSEAIAVSASATNASVSDLTWSADKSGRRTDFAIVGSFTIENLTDCSAIPTVEVQVTDLCGNTATASGAGAGIEDAVAPMINDLRFDKDATHAVRGTDYYVSDCCETRVYFSANVTDNCCVRSDRISVAIDVPVGGGGIVAEGVVLTQNGPNRVDVTGYLDVGCLTSCPARAEILILAEDCCGNRAEPAKTTESEGLIHDEVPPIPRDDPRQDVVLDGSVTVDPLVEVRRDGLGVYRLLVREDTPVRIDVLANDADNCSCADCAHPFDPCGSCEDCVRPVFPAGLPRCCCELTVDEIVDPPAYGTVTIEDAVGDCTGGALIRFAPDLGCVGPDQFTYRIRDACGNVSSQTATVYVQTVAGVSMEDVTVTACSGEPTAFAVTASDPWIDEEEVPFTFAVLGGPTHGVVVGDVSQVTYGPPSTMDVGGQSVTTLDVTETATIALVYTSTKGYVGRDAIDVRFEDPFGNQATARVDVGVSECAVGEPGIAALTLGRSETMAMIVPDTFATVVAGQWHSVLLISLADGAEHSEALSAGFDEALGRYVVYLDTGAVPIGRYALHLPLGNGETVELAIEIVAGESG